MFKCCQLFNNINDYKTFTVCCNTILCIHDKCCTNCHIAIVRLLKIAFKVASLQENFIAQH